MFDGEHGIALNAMQGNQASSHGEGEVSWFFLSCGGNLGTFSSYGGGGHLKLVFVQRRQDSCLVTSDTSEISTRTGRTIQTLLEVKQETQCPFLVATMILGFLSIFKKTQASSPFEALNSTCLSRCQRDVRTPVQMRQGRRPFSRVSTRDSDIPSSCEMKDEPAFKPLQGNPAFFRVSALWSPFHLRQKTQGPYHIPTAEGSLLLRSLWKVGLPLLSKTGNQLSSQDDMELSSS